MSEREREVKKKNWLGTNYCPIKSQKKYYIKNKTKSTQNEPFTTKSKTKLSGSE